MLYQGLLSMREYSFYHFAPGILRFPTIEAKKEFLKRRPTLKKTGIFHIDMGKAASFTCFPHRHGANTVDYVMAQPSFIPCIQDFTVGPRPVGIAVDHALLTFTISFQSSTAHRPQRAPHTRYTFTPKTDSVYIDGIYIRLCTRSRDDLYRSLLTY